MTRGARCRWRMHCVALQDRKLRMARPVRSATLSRHMTLRTKLGWILLAALASCVCEAQSMTTLKMLEKAQALTPDPRRGERLYIEYCSVCHRRSGWGNGPREVPSLAGQQDLYLLEQLIEFSVLDRKKAQMHTVVSRPELADPQAWRDVAAYAAQRPRNPSPERGDGTQLPVGEQVYTHSCATCHGENGEGSAEDLIPAIGGQQYRYLLIRLRNFTQAHDGQQGSAGVEPAVINLLARLTPTELEAVADYASRLTGLRGP
jgi:cytochrome c553